MALSTPFVGSGEFVPEREWSCSQHDYPCYHECDCSACTLGEVECGECAVSEWRDVFNADGTRKMREIGAFEAMLLRMPMSTALFPEPFLATAIRAEWVEDELMPGTDGR